MTVVLRAENYIANMSWGKKLKYKTHHKDVRRGILADPTAKWCLSLFLLYLRRPVCEPETNKILKVKLGHK